MSKALLVLDLINDIIDEKGSVGKDGFYNQAIKRDVVENTSNAIAWFRKKRITSYLCGGRIQSGIS